ncbi:MAG: tRNA pseudouridine(38-40) synthase TruA [Acholeplasmataceae bacterium]|jgi:pseudouridylate synthase I|nr:tRNA pseudouridine(38-40) synthase TruA [Acholeplasmataceae bacterium]
MRYLKLTISYDGTNYNGFQRQKNAIGIQQIVEDALSELMGEDIKVVASGRTDTGVHACGQVISFETRSTVPTEHITTAIRHLLPGDIVVWKAEEVGENFNARYSAVEKTYQYRIIITDISNPFKRNYAWELKKSLDIEKMQIAANNLLGTHDFTAFCNKGSKIISPERTITVAQWQITTDKELVFTITGDGFLYRMVRNIVGALVKVGNGKITPDTFLQILLTKDRQLTGMPAPACGLYLMHVRY